VEIQLPVIQAVTSIPDVESTKFYFDVENDLLDSKLHVVKDGKKCIDLLITFNKVIKGEDEKAESLREDEEDNDNEDDNEEEPYSEEEAEVVLLKDEFGKQAEGEAEQEEEEEEEEDFWQFL